MRALVVTASALLLAGCAADEPRRCANQQPGTSEVGVGDLATGFVPMADGSDARIVLGPQGLHMIVVSIRVHDFEAPADDGASHVTVAIEYQGQVVGGAIADVEPMPGAAGAADFLGLGAVFNLSDVRLIENEMVQLVGTVTDDCARPIEATRSVRVYF